MKEAEAPLDVTTIMLAREHAKYEARISLENSPKKKEKKLLSKMSRMSEKFAERKQVITNNITSNREAI